VVFTDVNIMSTMDQLKPRSPDLWQLIAMRPQLALGLRQYSQQDLSVPWTLPDPSQAIRQTLSALPPQTLNQLSQFGNSISSNARPFCVSSYGPHFSHAFPINTLSSPSPRASSSSLQQPPSSLLPVFPLAPYPTTPNTLNYRLSTTGRYHPTNPGRPYLEAIPASGYNHKRPVVVGNRDHRQFQNLPNTTLPFTPHHSRADSRLQTIVPATATQTHFLPALPCSNPIPHFFHYPAPRRTLVMASFNNQSYDSPDGDDLFEDFFQMPEQEPVQMPQPSPCPMAQPYPFSQLTNQAPHRAPPPGFFENMNPLALQQMMAANGGRMPYQPFVGPHYGVHNPYMNNAGPAHFFHNQMMSGQQHFPQLQVQPPIPFQRGGTSTERVEHSTPSPDTPMTDSIDNIPDTSNLDHSSHNAFLDHAWEEATTAQNSAASEAVHSTNKRKSDADKSCIESNVMQDVDSSDTPMPKKLKTDNTTETVSPEYDNTTEEFAAFASQPKQEDTPINDTATSSSDGDKQMDDVAPIDKVEDTTPASNSDKQLVNTNAPLTEHTRDKNNSVVAHMGFGSTYDCNSIPSMY
jgi:hypothetical protein